jgi:hypothetical protein
MPLFSRRDDVTLANPWGPAVTGWADVSRTLEAAAAHFREGHLSAFDILTKYVVFPHTNAHRPTVTASC